MEILLKLILLLQMPAPKCIGTAPPYSPTGVPLLKLIKLMGQRQWVITTPYI